MVSRLYLVVTGWNFVLVRHGTDPLRVHLAAFISTIQEFYECTHTLCSLRNTTVRRAEGGSVVEYD